MGPHKGVLTPVKKNEMSKLIAFVNQKGGTGKTTSTVNVGAGLSRLGRKTLAIDLDPQANLTYHLGINSGGLKATIAEVLEGRAGIEEAIVERDRLEKMKALAYWDRQSLKQVLDLAIESYLKGKAVKPIPREK